MVGDLSLLRHILLGSLWLSAISPTLSLPAQGADPVAEEPAEFQALDLDDNHAISLGEFLEGVSAPERLARTWSFHQQDSNSDSWLSAEEFSSKQPPENPRVVQFRGMDLDHNNSLSRSEYVDSADQKFQEAAGQEFVRFDRETDAQLSFEEFLETPRVAMEPAIQFARWDRNRDGQLSREEFHARFPATRHVLEKSAFFQRDQDGDGLVSASEFTTPPEKLRPHLKSRYASLDLDDDGKLSCEEYIRPYIGGKYDQAARDEASGADADRDGVLSISEFKLTPHGQVSTEELFSDLDADKDGRLTITEYLAPVEAKVQNAKRQEFNHHDQDGDLQLSMQEFSQPSIRARHAMRDQNADGQVTREEFYAPFIGGNWEKAARDEAVQYDSDGDGNISLKEFALVYLGDLTSTEVLEFLDTDQDGQLSRPEFINVRQESQRSRSSIDFLRRDLDENGFISSEELQAKARVEIPDPLAALADSTLQKFLATWETLDKDQDEKLSDQEWTADNSALLGACGKLPFTEWDLDRDGAVTREECQLVVAASYSLVRLDGRPLRQPTGIVANCAYIDAHDTNRDNQITRDEFLARTKGAEGENQFALLDSDDDKILGDQELFVEFRLAVDVLGDFVRIDADHDGQLVAGELKSSAHPWQVAMWPRLIPAFDQDQDGRLSFREYRLTPYANPAIEWYQAKLFPDRDADGRLSWEEFFPQKTVRFINLARHVFDHFDLNDDDSLSLNEFDFHTTQARAYTEVLFSTLDADSNRSLTITEFLAPVEAKLQSAKRDEFYYHDQDGDLQLSIDELMLPGDKCRPHIRAEYAKRDRNSDGGITREEYFTPHIGSQWEKAARDEAVLYDSDGDGNITLNEFVLGRISQLNSQELLDFFDTDQDGQLSRSEIVNVCQKSERMKASVAFLRRDRDGNGLISDSELQRENLPECPDPLAELSDSTLQKFLATWETLDKDQDGKVSDQEWPADNSALLGACGKLPFAMWDLDRDGSATREECQLIVGASYSLVRLDGRPLRQPTGIVANCAHIDTYDINRDNQITLNEFLAKSNGAEAEQQFASIDSDGDKILGDQELFVEFRLAVDVLGDFARIDADHDGQLAADELKSSAHPWQLAMWPRLIPAFDQDQDGRLSFREYRLTPYANPAIEWYQSQLFVDRDSDGRLSWEEFSPQKTVRFINLVRHVFDHFDLNDDRFLSLKEFDFQADLSRAPTEVVFESLDRDGNQKLDLADAVGLVKPTGTDPTAKLRWEERTMQVEDTIRLADKNNDNAIDQNEFQPHQAQLTAALNGQSIPRATKAVARSITGVAQGGDWNWRTIILVGANILLVGGIGWMVLRPRA